MGGRAQSVVGGEAREPTAVETGTGQQLLALYDTFMAREPLVLRKMSDRKLSLQACQDCAQEAFVRVLRKAAAGDLDDGVNLAAYVQTAARNLALDVLRGDRRLELTNGDGMETSVPAPPEAADVDVLKDLVMPAIDAMPVSGRRQVVRLQSQGLTDIEIAAALGIGAARVHRERYNAVIELRRALSAFIRHRHQKKTRLRKDR
ncbi:RNA polymerase sigma factor [Streptomyces sp. HUAS TT7]|uniref:RNA polymerase sigma factor n=1 Tax=Streptomyces sp. HUAS TT7 TaxID=3447507 RepID=UPI003F658C44